MKVIKHSKEWYYKARVLTWWLGLAFCVLPTLIVALVKLPVIASDNADSTLSGVFVVVLICAALPLYKALLRLIKTPNAAVICVILAAVVSLINGMEPQTRDGLELVLWVAAIGNTVGAVLFHFAKEFEELWRFCGQVTVTNEGGRGNG